MILNIFDQQAKDMTRPRLTFHVSKAETTDYWNTSVKKNVRHLRQSWESGKIKCFESVIIAYQTALSLDQMDKIAAHQNARMSLKINYVRMM